MICGMYPAHMIFDISTQKLECERRSFFTFYPILPSFFRSSPSSLRTSEFSIFGSGFATLASKKTPQRAKMKHVTFPIFTPTLFLLDRDCVDIFLPKIRLPSHMGCVSQYILMMLVSSNIILTTMFFVIYFVRLSL